MEKLFLTINIAALIVVLGSILVLNILLSGMALAAFG